MTFSQAVNRSGVSLAFIAKRGGWRLANVKRWYKQGAPRGSFGDSLIESLSVDSAQAHIERLGLEPTPGRIRNEIGDRLAEVASRGRIAPRSGRAVASVGKRASCVIANANTELVQMSDEKKTKLWEQGEI